MKTQKFNKSEILKKAWALVKRNGWDLRSAMKAAWELAKKPFVYKGDAERIFSSPVRKHTGLTSLQASLNRGI